jgi:hypothetical protein
MAKTKSRIANPTSMPAWTDLKPGMDYSKLDEAGVVKVGSYVDENTVIVGRYMELPGGKLADASEAAQVWTHGRVESVVVLVNNKGLRTVKIRCVEYRMPELGDKFSNRHGQKGTIGMVVRSHDLPRTVSGIVPDMIMNTHAIPSRMTIGHVIEMVMGKIAANVGSIADGTAFTDDGRLTKQMNHALEQLGFEKFGNEILYDGISGKQHSIDMFIGPIFSMRLKHMVEDKWNARGKGRREQRTHQPTGGRGAQGGLRIGEMERDAIVGHGISAFVNESYMLRSDGTSFNVCKGCGTIPIENPKTGLFVCPLCTGPVTYIGSGAHDLELIPPSRKTMVAPVTVEMPYAFKLLSQELETYMNIGMRIITEKDMLELEGVSKADLPNIVADGSLGAEAVVLPERVLPETAVPEYRELDEGPTEASPELLMKLGALPRTAPLIDDGSTIIVDATGTGAAINAVAGLAGSISAVPGPVAGSLVQTDQGQVFQPNPTTVTVVPPARTIQIMPGEAETLEADEELGVPLQTAAPQTAAQQTIPQVLPLQQQQPYPYPYPYPYPPPAYGAQPYYMPGQPTQQPLNMGQAPAIYATQQLPGAQIFTSGVPGAPPTISIPTDQNTMSQFALPSGPKPKKSITMRRRPNQGQGQEGGYQDEPSGSSNSASVVVTVSKMG